MHIPLSIPDGFYFAGKHVGIKYKRFDLGIIYSDTLCEAAAVFTKNSLCGVCIPIGRELIKKGRLQAVIVTSGVANVATGPLGIENTYTLMEEVAKAFSIPKETVLPSSTGIIGKQLPMEKIIPGMAGIEKEVSPSNWESFTKATMTTDRNVKVKSVKIGETTLLGICKGSGMLEPNMATMLAYFLTDASVDSSSLQKILKKAVDASFNMMSVDTDTSTSDTVALLANGKKGEVDLSLFEQELTSMCIDLAKEIVLDAEGATRLLEVQVHSASTFEDAKKVAKSIVNSPLVKTALHWKDPNWGRVLMAVGKLCDERVTFDKITISFNNVALFQKGNILESHLPVVTKYLQEESPFIIQVDLGLGDASAKVWGCDLTQEYILRMQ